MAALLLDLASRQRARADRRETACRRQPEGWHGAPAPDHPLCGLGSPQQRCLAAKSKQPAVGKEGPPPPGWRMRVALSSPPLSYSTRDRARFFNGLLTAKVSGLRFSWQAACGWERNGQDRIDFGLRPAPLHGRFCGSLRVRVTCDINGRLHAGKVWRGLRAKIMIFACLGSMGAPLSLMEPGG
jgi:hypothetical protein